MLGRELGQQLDPMNFSVKNVGPSSGVEYVRPKSEVEYVRPRSDRANDEVARGPASTE